MQQVAVTCGAVAKPLARLDLQKRQGKGGKPKEKNGGSVWESNPPMTGFTDHSTVLKTVDASTEPQQYQSVSDSASGDLARSLALLVQNHPDLVAVINAWPDVPQAVQAGILAMVQAAGAEK